VNPDATIPRWWEDGAALVPSEESLAQRVAAVALGRLSAVAVEADDGALTYGELVRAASVVASALRARGIGDGARVALAMPRTQWWPVGWLAVLECGASVVPLSLEDTSTRQRAMLEAAGVVGCIALADDAASWGEALGVPVWGIESLMALRDPAHPGPALGQHPVASSRECAVMFTSGTTGRPKGIRVPHRAVLRLVDGAAAYVSLGPSARVLGFAPPAFDASTFELWGALATGGTLCLAPRGPLSLDALATHVAASGCTVAWLTAGVFAQLVREGLGNRLAGLHTLMTGGDVVPPDAVLRLRREVPLLRVVNGYGPTENTTFTCFHLTSDDDPAVALPIGRPVPGTRVRVADANSASVSRGEVGELWAAGLGLALGYLEPDDDHAFVVHDDGEGPVRWYRTGDLARWRNDGTLAFHGRRDAQLKLSGYRVEPAELEQWLRAQREVADASVVVVGDGPMRRLAAAVVWAAPGTGPGASLTALRARAAEQLPAWMRPHPLEAWPALPLTANGKRDVAAVAARLVVDAASSAAPVPAPHQRDLASALQIGRVLGGVLGGTVLGPDESFFDRGGTSLAAMVAVAALAREAGITVSLGDFFTAPTPAGLQARVQASHDATDIAPALRALVTEVASARDGIAIVGMAGRFPGAASVEALWEMALAGGDGITRFAPDALSPLVPLDERRDPAYVPARGILPDIASFASAFFGVPPRQADLMDPQLRLLLELAWEVLETAGHGRAAGSRVGVFAGMNHSGYLWHHVMPHDALRRDMGPLAVQFATEKDYVATGIAHRLDLRGPAVSVHTACSTGLVAVAQACESLWRGQCDAALAGGVSLTVPQHSGHRHEAGAMFSADGVTRPFDVQATGTVFSDGAGVVMLKRLADAMRDGDTVHAVIRGVAVNNDGGAKASFTAPSVDGQAVVVRQALDDAGWSAADVSYVETHGTATPLGDPIEVEALARVFLGDGAAAGGCFLGARKGNIGHTTIASGIAGLMTAACAVRDGRIPPIAHFGAPNPALESDAPGFPFIMPTVEQPWPAGRPRRAGVSAFGVGGTNAHVVLEVSAPAPQRALSSGLFVLPYSAPDAATLAMATTALGDALSSGTRPDDAALTLTSGRRAMPARAAVVVGADRSWASEVAAGRGAARTPLPANAPLVFLCPGQGAQRAGVAYGVAEQLPVFAEQCRALCDVAGVPTRVGAALFGAPDPQAMDMLRDTAVAQPALVAVQVAMAAQWRAWGVVPTHVVGHSVGEIAAAAIAGILTPHDAMQLATRRGAAMQEAPRGRMLAVRADAETVAAYVGGAVSWAADNAPQAHTLSGPAVALAAVERALTARGVVTQWLQTSHAFHSPLLADAVEDFLRRGVPAVTAEASRTTFVSSVTALPESAALATPEYWRRQALSTVRFRDAVQWAARDGAVLVDVGPGTHAAGAARQALAGRPDVRVVAAGDDAASLVAGMLMAAGEVWCAGRDLDWAHVMSLDAAHRVPLPPTPLPRTHHWLAAASPLRATSTPAEPLSDDAVTRQRDVIAHHLAWIRAHG
jgi:amino acid adenylation domain-containing protein